MDDVITLIQESAPSYDQYGNERHVRTERELFCQVGGITRSEFYAAATVDMHPELTVTLSDYLDYEGEKLARYHGQLYSIVRTYRGRGQALNAIELVLERRMGNE